MKAFKTKALQLEVMLLCKRKSMTFCSSTAYRASKYINLTSSPNIPENNDNYRLGHEELQKEM